jgi:DMSO/TMAO reductase YedYZ molybdopterin-dependent catalytic subunit
MQSDKFTRRRFLQAVTDPTLAVQPVSRQPHQPSQVASGQTQLWPLHPNTAATTPVPFFFQRSAKGIVPVSPETWTLALGGMIAQPTTLTYQDLLALPSVELPATLSCANSTPSNPLIGHAVWGGTLLGDLIKRRRPHVEVTHAQFQAIDGYSTSVSLNQLADALLVYRMNGAPLTPEHGFPARLILPNTYGHRLPKWIHRIDMTNTPITTGLDGCCSASDDGKIRTMSAILNPRHLEILHRGEILLMGVAYAGDRAITKVEVSVDDGDWMPAPFTFPPSATWTRWQITWLPSAYGEYVIKVRATDSSGYTQREMPNENTFPKAASTLHTIIVRVEA